MYKDYDWEKTTLNNVTDIIGDGLHGTPKYSETGRYHFINGRNLNGKVIIDEKTKKVSEEEYQKYKKDLNSRTLFLSINGTIGKTAKYHGEKVMLGKSACYLNIKKDINKDFIYYLLQTPDFKYYASTYSTGTTIKNLGLKAIREYSFKLPPKRIQQKIATMLSLFDNKIENNNAIIANLEEQAQTIFKSWFVDFEPFQDGEFVESELGDIPKGWSIESLGDIVNIYDSERKPLSQMVRQGMERNYPYYGANGVIDYVEDYLFDGKYLLLGEDGTVQTNEGYPILNYIEEKFWVSNHAHIMTGDKISTEFLYVSIKRRNIRDIITGAVQQKINQRNLKSIKLVIPESNILINFQNIIEPIFEKVLVLKKSNKKLEETRDILLPKLMSGEIQVEEAIEVE